MTNRRISIQSALLAGTIGLAGLGFVAPAYGAPSTALVTANALYAKKTFSGGTVKISGTAKVGHTLTAKVSGLSPSSESGAKYKYQWLRNGSAISGAKGKTYAVTSSDAGKKLSVQVTATKDGYSSKSIASGTLKVASQPAQLGSKERPLNLGQTGIIEGLKFTPLTIRRYSNRPNGAPNGVFWELNNPTSFEKTIYGYYLYPDGNSCWFDKGTRNVNPGQTLYGGEIHNWSGCGNNRPDYIVFANKAETEHVFYRFPADLLWD